MKTYRFTLLLLVGILVFVSSGCVEVQESAGKAFGNAGSALRSGTGKLWIPEKGQRKSSQEEYDEERDERL